MAKSKTEPERVKVTINLPVDLVTRAKILAIEQDDDFQDLVADGLRLVLAREERGR